MSIVDFLRLANIIVATVSLPPIIIILTNILREGNKTGDRKTLHYLLRNMLILFTIIVVINALISFLLFVGFDFSRLFGETISQAIFNVRNILINISVSVVSWGFYFFLKKIEIV